MKVSDAYKLFTKNIPLGKRIVVRCFEYGTMFTFELGKPGRTDESMFDSVYYVDKKTEKVGVFQPFRISLEEYNSGKEVKNFK